MGVSLINFTSTGSHINKGKKKKKRWEHKHLIISSPCLPNRITRIVRDRRYFWQLSIYARKKHWLAVDQHFIVVYSLLSNTESLENYILLAKKNNNKNKKSHIYTLNLLKKKKSWNQGTIRLNVSSAFFNGRNWMGQLLIIYTNFCLRTPLLKTAWGLVVTKSEVLPWLLLNLCRF